MKLDPSIWIDVDDPFCKFEICSHREKRLQTAFSLPPFLAHFVPTVAAKNDLPLVVAEASTCNGREQLPFSLSLAPFLPSSLS